MVNRKRIRLGIIVLAGVFGCGVDGVPPASEQTAEICDANGTPIPLDPERKLALERAHNRVTQLFLNQPLFGRGRTVTPESYPDVDVMRSPLSITKRADNFPLNHPNTLGGRLPDRSHASFQERAASVVHWSWFQTNTSEPWQFRTVQLVGLVVHLEPVVYESDRVPMAKGVGEIPMRPLDAFEMRGLQKLRDGDDVYAETIPGKVARVMGPIYAGTSCVSCHAKTGELLGAFSCTYDIVKIAPTPIGVVHPLP